MKQLTPEQLEWCEKHLPEGLWKVNPEGLVDVEGKVDLVNQNFQRLPVAFGRVSYYFDLEDCKQLLTLEGSPREVGEWFDCSGCIALPSLEGAPQKVGTWFSCDGCKALETLKGSPQLVGTLFSCSGCKGLQSLDGVSQQVGRNLILEGCTGLPEWVHSLAKDFRKRQISWGELLQFYEKLLHQPKLSQAKNLGLF